MNIVLLSGGSGKRLWPLSNEIRSKQFMKIFKTEDGYESMIQRIYRQVCKVDPQANILIATSKMQVSSIRNQIGNVNLSIEPCRRDTFPAIALSAAYLHDVMHIPSDETMVVCPVDPYVEEGYFLKLKELSEEADKGDANLVLMGIDPTYPSEKYGYIIPETMNEISLVTAFKEKPTANIAKQYIAQGALWNSGVFAFRLSYVLKIAEEIFGSCKHDVLYSCYSELTKISFDYAVVEKENSIKVMRYHGLWKDLGTWNTMVEAMEENILGNGIMNQTCENVHIVNELAIPVLTMGLKNVVVSASSEGILVSDMGQSSYIKPFVDQISQPIHYAEKSWGIYRLIDVEKESLTIKVILKPGHQMNYHRHERRDEVWTVVSGEGYAILDGVCRKVKQGDVLSMPAGSCHMVHAETELVIIEVQLGKDIDVRDKIKIE